MMQLSLNLGKIPDFEQFTKVFQTKRSAFYATAMKLVVDDIVRGILSGNAIVGGRFPTLADSTIRRKGHDRALVDKGLFSDAYTYEQINMWRDDRGEISIKPLTAPAGSKWGLLNRAIGGNAVKEKKGGGFTRTRAAKGAARDTPRDQVGRYLQINGLKNGKKFMFFGISKDAEDQIMGLLEILVEEALAEI